MKSLKKIIVLSIGVLFSITLASQNYTSKSSKAIKLFEAGRAQYNVYNYAEAEPLLNKAIKADSKFIEAYIVLGRMYADIDSIDKAIETYNIGLSIDPSFYKYGYGYKGQLEMKIGRYENAVESFSTLLKLEPKSEKHIKLAQEGLNRAEFALELKKHPVYFAPVRLDSSVNSSDDEYWPSLSTDEQTLVFTRLVGPSMNNPKKQEDFYVSQREGNTWSFAKNVGRPLNTPDNEGAQTISGDGSSMVYTVCNRRGVIGRCDLYCSQRIGDQWGEPYNLGIPVNSSAKETQPSLSADGRTLYFASNRPGGKGGMDIWVAQKNDDGTWGQPENLGDSVNTPGMEISPFIHHDNKTLYFSSNYHLGMGGADIFYSHKKNDGAWSKAKNIGYPINTHKDEIGLIISAKGDMAYYSSDIGGNRGRDIYQFELYDEARPQEVSYMKGFVFDVSNKKVLNADFELFRLDNGELISKSHSDPYTGEFLVCIPTDNNYMLNVSKEGYLFFSENFSLSGVHEATEPFHKNVPMQPLVVGKSIVLRNVFFETNSYSLKGESFSELNKVVKFLEVNPDIRIEISGHTDNVGGKDYNMELSDKRAKSVVDYLIKNGVQSSRLDAKGYGVSKPVDSNNTPEGRANNRRTELMVID